MTPEEIQAVQDCKKIWRYMAITGYDKIEAVIRLKRKGQIKDYHRNFCPLCAIFYACKSIVTGEYCPWIQIEGDGCMAPSSIYKLYRDQAKIYRCNKNKNIASKVYQKVIKHLKEE